MTTSITRIRMSAGNTAFTTQKKRSQSAAGSSLHEVHKPGLSADALYSVYTSFGDDPFIVVVDGEDSSTKFSAWNYAKGRCRLICGERS